MKEKFDPPIVNTCEELENYPNEYKEAIVKLIRKHNGKDMGDLQHSVDLAKELVTKFKGELNLIVNPSAFDHSLPEEGNAFVIIFPV